MSSARNRLGQTLSFVYADRVTLKDDLGRLLSISPGGRGAKCGRLALLLALPAAVLLVAAWLQPTFSMPSVRTSSGAIVI